MSKGQAYSGSINVTDLLAKLNEKHSAFNPANNGKIYCNITIWVNEEDDQYGHRIGIQLNSRKEKAAVEKKFYIGNAKINQVKPTNLSNTDLTAAQEAFKNGIGKINASTTDDLPF